MNNLNELNEILFETLRKVKDDQIDNNKANAIVGLSNSIISNAKTQLNAYKITKGRAYKDTFGALPPPSESARENSDKYLQKSEFAMAKGYDNVSEAMGDMGKNNFEREFSNWIKST